MRRLTIFLLCLLGGCLAGCASMRVSIGIDRLGDGYGLVLRLEVGVEDKAEETVE